MKNEKLKQKRLIKREDKTYLYGQRNKMRLKPTGGEITLANKLKDSGYFCILQFAKYHKGFMAIFDIYLPDKKMAIEIDGSVHLAYEQSIKDKIRDKIVWEVYGIKTLRITNEQAVKLPVDMIFAISKEHDYKYKKQKTGEITQLKGWEHGKKCDKCKKVAHWSNGVSFWCGKHFHRWKNERFYKDTNVP
jgi:very-short-patch-repair endonuclease